MRKYAACIIVIVSSLVAGCAGSNYLGDRGRDALDIVAATAGAGAGLKARVGPAHVGLLANLDLWGVRNGVVLAEGCMMVGGIETDTLIIPVSSGSEVPSLFPVMFGMTGYPVRKCAAAGALSHVPFISLPMRLDDETPLPWSERARYLTQVEVVVAVGGSVRLGINPLEAVDFILGWTTLDILGDDSAREIVIRGTHCEPEPGPKPEPED